jgi:ATP-binding cassette, subfamily F, member 3
MHIIHIHNLMVNLGGYIVFRDLSWTIGDHDRVGLVGPNGAGKSTLIKTIAGAITPDQGKVAKMGGVTVGYLPQEVELDGDTLIDAALKPSPDLARIAEELAAVENRMDDPAVYGDADALAAALERQAELIDLHERHGGRYASSVRELLARLGFSAEDYDLPAASLSGGQRKMVALARLAAWQPTVLLLDEPDNHLDLRAKRYLEQFIHSYPGSVVIISHDRYLLDEAVNQITELDGGTLTSYVGNYSSYATQRELARIRQQQQYVAQQKRIQQIEAAIHEWEQLAKADLSERHARQAASRRKMLARMEERGEMIERVTERRYMELDLGGGRGSTKAIELSKVAMGFGDDLLFCDLDLLVRHGERVGLVGANGAGKSVLFRLILGQYEPLDGVVKVGPSTKIGYYAQQHETLTTFAARTPIELLRDVKPMPEQEAVRLLLKFTFSYEQTRQPIGTFSGGERSRLQLLALMLEQPNLLLLDEPTNNLDIGSAEVLEQALDEFEGTVLTISHDRYFLDRVVDRVVELENGALTDYPECGYTGFVAEKARRAELQRQKHQRKDAKGQRGKGVGIRI